MCSEDKHAVCHDSWYCNTVHLVCRVKSLCGKISIRMGLMYYVTHTGLLLSLCLSVSLPPQFSSKCFIGKIASRCVCCQNIKSNNNISSSPLSYKNRIQDKTNITGEWLVVRGNNNKEKKTKKKMKNALWLSFRFYHLCVSCCQKHTASCLSLEGPLFSPITGNENGNVKRKTLSLSFSLSPSLHLSLSTSLSLSLSPFHCFFLSLFFLSLSFAENRRYTDLRYPGFNYTLVTVQL